MAQKASLPWDERYPGQSELYCCNSVFFYGDVALFTFFLCISIAHQAVYWYLWICFLFVSSASLWTFNNSNFPTILIVSYSTAKQSLKQSINAIILVIRHDMWSKQLGSKLGVQFCLKSSGHLWLRCSHLPWLPQFPSYGERPSCYSRTFLIFPFGGGCCRLLLCGQHRGCPAGMCRNSCLSRDPAPPALQPMPSIFCHSRCSWRTERLPCAATY